MYHHKMTRAVREATPEGMSFCVDHDDYLPLSAFGVRAGGKYVRTKCKPCYNAQLKKWRDTKTFTINGIERKGVWLQRKYGIYGEDYVRMYTEQDGKCAICNDRPKEVLLMVDHNHDTGAVRELLCRYCNSLLGFSKEDSSRLKKAAEYLEKHNG